MARFSRRGKRAELIGEPIWQWGFDAVKLCLVFCTKLHLLEKSNDSLFLIFELKLLVNSNHTSYIPVQLALIKKK